MKIKGLNCHKLSEAVLMYICIVIIIEKKIIIVSSRSANLRIMVITYDVL